MAALLTLTGQNTPASFSLRRTFFYAHLPSFREGLLNAVPFNRSTVCGHSGVGVSAWTARVTRQGLQPEARSAAGFLTTFFLSLRAFTEIPVCSLEKGLYVELCAETRGAGLAGVGAEPGRQ